MDYSYSAKYYTLPTYIDPTFASLLQSIHVVSESMFYELSMSAIGIKTLNNVNIFIIAVVNMLKICLWRKSSRKKSFLLNVYEKTY